MFATLSYFEYNFESVSLILGVGYLEGLGWYFNEYFAALVGR